MQWFSMPAAGGFCRGLVVAIAALAIMGLFASGALAQGEGDATQPREEGFTIFMGIQWFVIGTLCLLFFLLLTMIIWLLIDFRGAIMMPPEFVEEFQDAVNKRQFKKAYELTTADGSMVARVMTAGMTRLQHGLEEARDAAYAVAESAKSRKDHTLSYIATIGTLGPLLGLVGTVIGMIGSFGELGGGAPNTSKLAGDISHALWATLLGISLSVPAIFFYAFFRNRLARIANDVHLMSDDLLTQMYFSSRKPDGNPSGSKPPAASPPTGAPSSGA